MIPSSKLINYHGLVSFTTRPFAAPAADSKELLVQMAPEAQLLVVKGTSMQNIDKKYQLFLILMERHLEIHDRLMIYFRYDQFNASTAKYLLSAIKALNKHFKNGKQVKILWSCTGMLGEEMFATGSELKQLCDFPFEINWL